MTERRKVVVVGLDCATPEIVFGRRRELPVLNRLIEGGFHGTLRSSDPPITIPAWMVMATGKELGNYERQVASWMSPPSGSAAGRTSPP